MFKASLKDPKLLKCSIDAISNIIDEAGISVSKEGLRLKAMDPAHVALVDFELKKEAFDEFEVGEQTVMGIDLDRFNTILKRAGGDDKISLQLSPEKDVLRIKFSNSSTRIFDLPLIDVSEEELKEPNLKFSGTIKVNPKIIGEGLKDAEIVSDHVVLKTAPGHFLISARGDLGNVEIKVGEDEAIISYEGEGEISSMFSIEYLKDMAKASDIADSVKISLGNDLPVKMDFLAEGARLSFLLAPRMEG
jgi:proliferating cell nuclear antigen